MNLRYLPGLVFALVAVMQAHGESATCKPLNDAVLSEVASGRIKRAEAAALASGNPLCTGVVLNNIAAVMNLNHRAAEAERFAEKSVRLLEQTVAPDDIALLRPLQVLSSSLLQQNKVAKACETFRRMLRIHIERPADRALLHEMEGA